MRGDVVSEYKRLVAEGKIKALPPTRDPLSKDVAEARRRELTRRHMEARRRSLMVLKARYPHEWDELFYSELKTVHEERGLLPGDEEATR